MAADLHSDRRSLPCAPSCPRGYAPRTTPRVGCTRFTALRGAMPVGGQRRDWKVVRPSRWRGAASSALVSRSRAMPVGDRWPVLPVGARCRARSTRFGSTRLAGSAWLTAPRRQRMADRAKQMAANRRFAACVSGGECVKGGLAPLSQESNDASELAAARRRRARKFRCPARSAGRFGRGALFPPSRQSELTQRCAPPPGTLDLKLPAPRAGSQAGPDATDHSKRRYAGRHF